MPGVSVEDEVGRLLLRGYRIAYRSDEEAVLSLVSARKGGQITLFIVGLLIGIAGVIMGLADARLWMMWVGVGVIVISLFLFWLSARPSGIRVYVDQEGRIKQQRVRGSQWCRSSPARGRSQLSPRTDHSLMLRLRHQHR